MHTRIMMGWLMYNMSMTHLWCHWTMNVRINPNHRWTRSIFWSSLVFLFHMFIFVTRIHSILFVSFSFIILFIIRRQFLPCISN